MINVNSGTSTHCVVVDVQNFPQRRLVSAGEIPNDWDVHRMKPLEHDLIPLVELLSGEDTSAEGVIPVRVRSCLE